MGAVATSTGERHNAYQRHRPETTALYEVVRDNLETLYGAIDNGALDVRLPKHARKELEAYLDCGLLCRGFARLYCASCEHSQLVAFSCKGRGYAEWLNSTRTARRVDDERRQERQVCGISQGAACRWRGRHQQSGQSA